MSVNEDLIFPEYSNEKLLSELKLYESYVAKLENTYENADDIDHYYCLLFEAENRELI